MKNELIKKDTDIRSKIDLIKRTVAKGATDDEFDMFMHLAKSYQLDPISKEIWFIKYDNTKAPTIMTSRDGYLAIANRNEHYDGMLSDVVHENDDFEKMPDGGIKHKYNCKSRGEIIGAYALGYRDDRKFPIYIFAQLSEYNKNNNVWKQYTSAMILKVAEAMMLKRLFSISGLVTREEMDEEYNIDSQNMIKPTPKKEDTDLATQPQLNLISKQVISSHLLTEGELKKISGYLEEGLTKAKGSQIIKWWLGNKGEGIMGERERREKVEREKREKAEKEAEPTKEENIALARHIVGGGKLQLREGQHGLMEDDDEEEEPGSSINNAIPYKGNRKKISEASDYINPEDIPD